MIRGGERQSRFSDWAVMTNERRRKKHAARRMTMQLRCKQLEAPIRRISALGIRQYGSLLSSDLRIPSPEVAIFEVHLPLSLTVLPSHYILISVVGTSPDTFHHRGDVSD